MKILDIGMLAEETELDLDTLYGLDMWNKDQFNAHLEDKFREEREIQKCRGEQMKLNDKKVAA